MLYFLELLLYLAAEVSKDISMVIISILGNRKIHEYHHSTAAVCVCVCVCVCVWAGGKRASLE